MENKADSSVMQSLFTNMETQQLFDLLRKEAECSFCIHQVNKPKTLPCLHSFCLDCLNKYAATRRQQGHTTFDCPVCLATFQLPNIDKFDGFQTAFHQNRLLFILALEQSDTGQQKSCDNCDKNAAASSYCFECETFVCSACLDIHNLLKVVRAHRIVSLQNLQTADVEALIQRPVLCDKPYHEREQLEYYCEDCRVCICHKCAFVEHNKHSMLDIPRVAEQHKRRLTKDVEQMKSRISEWKQEIEKSKKNFESIEQQIEEARHKAQATVETLIRHLKIHEANIMRELNEVHQTQQQAHLAQLENFELSVAKLNSAIEYAEVIMARNVGQEILQTQEPITQRCEMLTEQNITVHTPVCVGLVINDELYHTVRQSVLGRVVVKLTDHSRSVAVGEGLQRAERRKRAEFTIITKDAEGQQCYDKTDQVTVHIQTAAQEEVEVTIDTKKDGIYHVAYLPQRVGQHHVIVNLNGQLLTGSPWNVHVTPHQYQPISSLDSVGTRKGQFTFPFEISVSSIGNIDVADFFNNRVQVFTSKGKYLREFGQGILKYPRDIAYTSPDHIIVICSGQVWMFTESGTFIRQFSPVHLKRPWSVSVTDDGRVIACDWDDKAVKVLSPDGEELLLSFGSQDCNVFPWLSFCHKEKIFVTYFNKNCIKVFDMTGNYLHDIGCTGTGNGQLHGPRGVGIDKFGDLLVVDTGNHRLQVFTTEGEFVSKAGNKGRGLGQFTEPSNVAVSKNGHVYVNDRVNNCVQIFM